MTAVRLDLVAVAPLVCWTALAQNSAEESARVGYDLAMPGGVTRHKNSPPSQTNFKPRSVTLSGTAQTASPAESVALNGNIAYVCDDNEVSVFNVANPSSPQLLTTATSGSIQNSGNMHCAVQRSTLAVFADQTSTAGSGTGPAFIAFSLGNPSQPQVISATPVNHRFFEDPAYIGNYAFVPTATVHYFDGGWMVSSGTWWP